MHLINKSRASTECFRLVPDLRRKAIVSAIQDRHQKSADFFILPLVLIYFNLID